MHFDGKAIVFYQDLEEGLFYLLVEMLAIIADLCSELEKGYDGAVWQFPSSQVIERKWLEISEDLVQMLWLRSYVKVGNQSLEGLLANHFLLGEIVAFDVRPRLDWSKLVDGEKVGEMDVLVQVGLDLQLVEVVPFAGWLEEVLKVLADHLLVLFGLEKGVFVSDEEVEALVVHLEVLWARHDGQQVTLCLQFFISIQYVFVVGKKSKKLEKLILAADLSCLVSA